jgi:hypothetical protein
VPVPAFLEIPALTVKNMLESVVLATYVVGQAVLFRLLLFATVAEAIAPLLVFLTQVTTAV